MRRSTSARSMILLASLRSSRGQPPMMSIASSNASGSRSAGMSASARRRSCAFLLRLTASTRKRLFCSPPRSKCGIATARRQAFGATAGPAPAVGPPPRPRQDRPRVLLAVVEVLDGDPPQLALEDGEAPLLLGADGQHAALDAHPPPAPAAHGADDDRAAAIDVAVEQRVQRHDGVVVLRPRVDEIHDEACLLAGMAARDAPDALLVDALRRGRGEVHAD